MLNPFAEVERKYRELFAAYQRGEVDEERFAQELGALQVQDDQQRWWQIQGNGAWLCFNPANDRWEEGVPPQPLPPPPPRSALAPPPRLAASDVQPEPIAEPDDQVLDSTAVSVAVSSRPALDSLLHRPAVRPLPLQVAARPLAARLCQACQSPLLPQARFCGHCGQPAGSFS